MKYPFEKQKDLKDCGVCCLLMITRYYGGGVSKEYLRDLTNTTKDGVSAYDLIEGAKRIGFDSFGVKGKITDLKNDYTPCIAHVIYKKSYQHFIVIYKVNKKKKTLLIADPNNNHLKTISFKDFESISTDTYILLKPRKKVLYVSKNKTLKEFLLNTMTNFTPDLIRIIFLSIIIVLIQILLSFEFKILLEYVINYETIYNLYLLGIVFISVILLKEISKYFRNKTINILNHQLDKSLFQHVYNHLLSLPYLYYKNRTTGEITSRMNDLTNIRDVVSKSCITMSIDAIMLIGAFICLFLINNTLAMIVLGNIVILSLLVLLFNRMLEDGISKTKQYAAKLNSFLVESIGGIETIKSQNILSYSKKKFLLNYSKYNKTSLNYNNSFIILDFLKNLVNEISNILILIIGSYLVVKHKLDIASLITFITLSSYVFSPINSIMDLILSIKEAKISYERIRELYEIKEEKVSNNKLKQIHGNIKSNHLNYSYNNRDIFLKDINIEIKEKDKILIYGKSGSGKSTLAKLIAGQLKTNNKNILIDNIDINRYSNESLRQDICYVSSKEKLFTDSIYNNIILDKNIPFDTFNDITKLCMVEEVIDDKPLAYDTLLEEDGFNLSGGEKQRIILARSLLKNSNIYILDEALNQVDVERERKILLNIFNKYPDKTFLYISHRFHNADLFDKKYKIEDGVSYEESI